MTPVQQSSVLQRINQKLEITKKEVERLEKLVSLIQAHPEIEEILSLLQQSHLIG